MADGNRGKYRNNIGITSNKFMKKTQWQFLSLFIKRIHQIKTS